MMHEGWPAGGGGTWGTSDLVTLDSAILAGEILTNPSAVRCQVQVEKLLTMNQNYGLGANNASGIEISKVF